MTLMMTQITTNRQNCPEKAVSDTRGHHTASAVYAGKQPVCSMGDTQRAPRNACPAGGSAVNCGIRYAKVLYELNMNREAIQKAEEIFAEVPQLKDVLINPTIREEKKFKVIDRVFPEEIRNFLKVACRHHRMELIGDIFKAYHQYCDEQNKILNAVLTCVEPPSEVQLNKMKAFLCKKYDAVKADIEIVQDKALLGGFVLRVGCDEFDWSLQGRLNRLEQKLTRR
ncbi:hypothetical protein CE91St64_02910 [Faecalicatena contorta]|nr:hypothetical protein CE91St64_02910 [Faecalicatena contorta]